MNTLLLKPSTNNKNNGEVEAFIRSNIADFRGEIKEDYPFPRMLFNRQDFALSFVNKIAKSLGIPRACFIVVAATSEMN